MRVNTDISTWSPLAQLHESEKGRTIQPLDTRSMTMVFIDLWHLVGFLNHEEFDAFGGLDQYLHLDPTGAVVFGVEREQGANHAFDGPFLEGLGELFGDWPSHGVVTPWEKDQTGSVASLGNSSKRTTTRPLVPLCLGLEFIMALANTATDLRCISNCSGVGVTDG